VSPPAKGAWLSLDLSLIFFLFCAILKGMEYRMTLTIDLIDSGALNLLRDMERLNLIRLNPPVNDNIRIVREKAGTYLGHDMTEKKDTKQPTPLTDSLCGLLSHVGDISPEEIREERLSKYLKSGV
jgi:hypothetical protein